MNRATTALLGLLTALGGVLALAGPAHADPLYQAPVVGECHDYSMKTRQGVHETSAPVACDAAHTALVVAVVQVPKRLLRGDGSKAGDRVERRCDNARTAALGGPSVALQALSAYTGSYFIPTKAQVAAGARWVRCDLNLAGGTKLLDLAADPALTNPPAEEVRRCSDAKLRRTACTRPHVERAVYGLKLKGAYPANAAAARRQGERYCAAASQASTGRGKNHYDFGFATRSEWNHGDKYVICYAVTKK